MPKDFSIINRNFFSIFLFFSIFVFGLFFSVPAKAEINVCVCSVTIRGNGFDGPHGECSTSLSKEYALNTVVRELDKKDLYNKVMSEDNGITSASCKEWATANEKYETKTGKEPYALTEGNCAGFESTSQLTGPVVGDKLPEGLEMSISDCRIITKEGENTEDVLNKANFLALKSQAKSLNQLGLSGGQLPILIGRVIKIIMGVVGSIALAMLVYGGLVWMTARGNSERTTMAIKILTWAIMGVIVILSSYVLVDFVFKAF